MQYEHITLQQDRGIATLTLARPQKMNALNDAMLREIGDALDACEADPAIRAMIVTGSERAFSAGYDVDRDDEGIAGVDGWRRQFRFENAVLWRIWDARVPVVAAVQGYCLGLGLDLALVCDITIAAEDAVLGAPEVRFQAAPSFLIVPWLVGMKKAKELLLTGDQIGAAEADRIGLINKVVAPDELADAAWEIASKLAKMPPPGVQLAKSQLNGAYDIRGFRSTVTHASELAALLAMSESEEAREFFRVASNDGFKAAFKWRDDRFEAAGD